MIIFETDGMINTTAAADFTDSGAYNSYYNVRIGKANEYPYNVWGGDPDTATQQTSDVVARITALDTDSLRGYSTSRKPVLIHCIAFGSLFNDTSNAFARAALQRLQTIQYKGGQAGGEQPDTTTALKSYKIITGSFSDRITKMQQTFNAIMQDGVQVSLLQ